MYVQAITDGVTTVHDGKTLVVVLHDAVNMEKVLCMLEGMRDPWSLSLIHI